RWWSPLPLVSFVHQAAALGDGVRTAHSINSPPKVSIFMGTLLLGRDSTAIEVARCRSGRLGGTGLYVSDLHREPRNVTAGAVATARNLGTPMRTRSRWRAAARDAGHSLQPQGRQDLLVVWQGRWRQRQSRTCPIAVGGSFE